MSTPVYLGAWCNYTVTNAVTSFQRLMFGGTGAEPGPGTGQLKVRRSFVSGAPPSTWSSLPCASDPGLGCDVSIVTLKGTFATWLNGGYDANVLGIMNTMPDTQTLILCPLNEPENKGIDVTTWRQIMKRIHRLVVENRGTKKVYMGSSPLIVDTPYTGVGNYDLTDWISVYTSSDTGDFAPPTGFSVGDIACDYWCWNAYDRYPDNANAPYRLEWDPLPAGVGNVQGFTGVVDQVISEINTYPGGSATRATFNWAILELGTERTGTAQRDWYAAIVQGMAADVASCHSVALFVDDVSGTWAPFPIHSELQQWMRDNTTDGVYGDVIPPPPEALFVSFDDYADGDPIVPNSGGDAATDQFDIGYGTFEADAKSIDWGDATSHDNALLIVTDASGAAGWDAKFGTLTAFGFRFPFYLPNGLPTANIPIVTTRSPAAQFNWWVRATTTGGIDVAVDSNTVDSSAGGLIAGDGTHYWLTGWVDATAGTVTVHLWDSTGSLLATLSATGQTFLGSAFEDFRVGKFATQTGFHVGVLPILTSTDQEPAMPQFATTIAPLPATQTVTSYPPAVDAVGFVVPDLADQTLVVYDPTVDALSTLTIEPGLAQIVIVGVRPIVTGEGITVLHAERGVFYRHATTDRLALVYGTRGMLTGFRASEGWEPVSGLFLFQWDTRTEVLDSILAPWSANKAETAATLAAALDSALNTAGYRAPDGTAVAYGAPVGTMT